MVALAEIRVPESTRRGRDVNASGIIRYATTGDARRPRIRRHSFVEAASRFVADWPDEQRPGGTAGRARRRHEELVLVRHGVRRRWETGRDDQIARMPRQLGSLPGVHEAQFSRLEPLLPKDIRGKPRVDDQRVISGIVHVLASGGGCRCRAASPRSNRSRRPGCRRAGSGAFFGRGCP